MRIGWVGLGKLGLPSAGFFAGLGHEVVGYDIAPRSADGYPNLSVGSLREACAGAETVFIAVPTPHAPGYGGDVTVPDQLTGFDVSYLRGAVAAVAKECEGTSTVIAVVSTVLPGTCRAELAPLLRGLPFVYHPFFVAMGTVAEDLADPEFVLLGSDDPVAAKLVGSVYDPIHGAPRLHVRMESAEVAKMTYNTLISLKVLAANAVMEISEKVDADCDEVADVLSLATQRVVSTRYMRAGMGDGGACHPRDAIAMAYLAKELRLSADVFGFAVRAREAQSRWLAGLVADAASWAELPVVVMGRAYKMGVDLTDGSAALLLCHHLEERGVAVVNVDTPAEVPVVRAVYMVAKADPAYAAHPFPIGSVVIDPWGMVADIEGVDVRRVGRR